MKAITTRGTSDEQPASEAGARAWDGQTPADGAPDGADAEAHFPAVYAQLRAVAAHYLSGGGALTLQPTALVHEAYLRLAGASEDGASWRDRAHFCAVAARAMRQALVDHLRRKSADKRGGGWERVTLTGVPGQDPDAGVDLLALEAALERLQALDARQARIVELRFFGGLSVVEVAGCLGVSVSTVEKEWRAARAWLGMALAADAR
ncbi:MAG: ECF-type sigma factor [Myxococcaceae bacterium]|nr:ECF-type sigma factor [Myxococcaceae bacterium]MCI0669900.1 ECF-type sigma factor [Myxococcaceae bacterium]